MNGKKVVFLFLAFLLPICIFIFLKIFGKNEFRVEPLFQDDKVKITQKGCGEIKLPYKIPAEILSGIITTNDSLAIVYFGTPDQTFLKLEEALKSDPVVIKLNDPVKE